MGGRGVFAADYGFFFAFGQDYLSGVPVRYINDDCKVGVPYNEFLYDAWVLNSRYISRKPIPSIWSNGGFVMFRGTLSKVPRTW